MFKVITCCFQGLLSLKGFRKCWRIHSVQHRRKSDSPHTFGTCIILSCEINALYLDSVLNNPVGLLYTPETQCLFLITVPSRVPIFPKDFSKSSASEGMFCLFCFFIINAVLSNSFIPMRPAVGMDCTMIYSTKNLLCIRQTEE